MWLEFLRFSSFDQRLIGLLGLLVIAAAAEDLNIISKSEWHGKEAKEDLTQLVLPLNRVIVCHSTGNSCTGVESCGRLLRIIQDYHMNVLNFDDIAYNFLIGNDGNVYEGRGWEQQGAFAMGYNAGSLGVAFIGNYGESLPTQQALEALKSLLELGIRTGKLTADYRLLGHRQVADVESPGDALYDEIKQWPHWSSKTTT